MIHPWLGANALPSNFKANKSRYNLFRAPHIIRPGLGWAGLGWAGLGWGCENASLPALNLMGGGGSGSGGGGSQVG